ncbi:MAG: YbhB/YbcL family Raf kinase inhibitor-like protein [bacterium]
MKFFHRFYIAICLCCCGGAKTNPATAKLKKNDVVSIKKIVISSPAFGEGEKIPVRYTGDGEDISPELEWDSVPSATKSFALLCLDPDAPFGTFIHWIVYNIAPDVRRLPEGMTKKAEIDDNTRQGVNSFKHIGYNGPKPPPGKAHRYIFRIYALDTTLDLPKGAAAGKLLEAMSGHIVAQGELTGIYGR